jgi:hypothetical protein
MGARPVGQSAGRPKGSRNKLNVDYFGDLYTVWSEHGIGGLRVMAVEKPDRFCQMVANLMPREMSLAIETVERTMSDEELYAHLQRIEQLYQARMVDVTPNKLEAPQ